MTGTVPAETTPTVPPAGGAGTTPPAGGAGAVAGDLTGIVTAMLPVTDLATSVAWYRRLLGLRYVREFETDGVVTGCALADPAGGYLLSFRLRSATAGDPDLRGEHPLIFGVRDRPALERIRAHATDLGYHPTSGEHGDAAWVEVVDPDGIATRFAWPTGDMSAFSGVRFHPDGRTSFYGAPRLTSDGTDRTPDGEAR
jgi:catechol 2,3-dioxygenase-like lactoylglutathione lyase family enzyme